MRRHPNPPGATADGNGPMYHRPPAVRSRPTETAKGWGWRVQAAAVAAAIGVMLGGSVSIGAAEVVESFDSLSYVFPRQGSLWTDGSSFALGSGMRLEVQAGARVRGTALKWTIRGQGEAAAIAVARATPFPVGRVSFWVKNPYGHKAAVQVGAVTAAGEVLAWKPADVGQLRGWTQLVFVAADLSGKEAAGPVLPVKEWRLAVLGLEAGREYTFFVDEFAVEQLDRGAVRLVRMEADEVVTPGQRLRVTARIRSSVMLNALAGLCVEMRDGSGRLVALGPLAAEEDVAAGGETVMAGELVVPTATAAGRYSVAVSLGPGGEILGRKAVTIGGESAEPVSGHQTRRPWTVIADLSGGLAHLPQGRGGVYLVPVTCNYDAYGLGIDRTDGDGWAGVDVAVCRVLRSDPAARMVLRAYVGAHPQWCEQHANECMEFRPPPRGRCLAPRARRMPSYTSQVWRKDAIAQLRELVRHVENAPWASQVVGYVLAAGADGAWAYPRPDGRSLADYSAPQQRAFRAFLKARYRSLAELRSAWGQPRRPVIELLEKAPPDEPRPILSWAEVAVPEPARRMARPMSLLEPPAAQEVVDYRGFHGHAAAAAAVAMARATKEECKNKPVGVEYGSWMLEAANPAALFATGHSAIGEVAASEAVDFLVVPAAAGEAAGVPPVASSSLDGRGKRWFVRLRDAGGDDSSRAMFSAMAALAHGAAGVVVPVPALSASKWLPALRHVGAMLNRAKGPAAQVAAIADPDSMLWLAPDGDLGRAVLAGQLAELVRTGAGVEVWWLSDVARRSLRGRRMYVFLNPFVLDDRQREDVAILKDRGHLLVFSYAAGAIRPGQGISGKDIMDLTGVPVTSLSRGGELKVRAAAGIEPWTAGLARDVVYGPKGSITPRFACVGTEAEVLGHLGKGRLPALAVRKLAGWTSVYSAAPDLPWTVLRSLARAAGARVLWDGQGPVAAGRGIVAVLAESGGMVRIPAEQAVTVLRLTEVGWEVVGRAGPGQEFSLQLEPGEVGLFVLRAR